MYFYLHSNYITQEAINALAAVGLEFHNGGEMVVPDNECVVNTQSDIVLKGVHLGKHVLTFNGTSSRRKRGLRLSKTCAIRSTSGG